MVSIKDSAFLEMKPGPHWSSFEKFRTEGVKSLESIKEGTVAVLVTKTGQYRIIEEHDFQKILGLARDVARLRSGLKLVLQSARVVQKHPDDSDTIELLVEAVTMLGSLPELPTQDHFEPLVPESANEDTEDEVELDPNKIELSMQLRELHLY
jgi:hypothetical protein